MMMAKPSANDIEAASDAMSALNNIGSGYYPTDDGEDTPTFFDPDDRDHLRLFYDLMKKTLDDAPGWQNRVIGGMCYVIMFDKNQIIDPDDDCLGLHPRFAAVAAERDKLMADAARYRLLRRGQSFSVINGIGDVLRADALDASLDAVMSRVEDVK